ncbi:MAG: DEAD/DEAH box helicase [Acidimicrobiia bacterium]
MPTFADLGVPTALSTRLEALGIAEPFPVQAAVVPDALAGRDVCAEAPTGSGKTLAFGIPVVARVGRARARRPRALVLVPTRELAAQVADQLAELTKGSGRTVVAIYGGASMQRQVTRLAGGAEIAVATPGRLEDLVRQGTAVLDEVDLVVVDEADRMADMGFLPVVRRLLDQVRSDRQTLLLSATLGGEVDALSRAYQLDPVRRRAEAVEAQGPVAHHFWSVDAADRIRTATEIVRREWPAIVFCRTKHGADRVARAMNRAGVTAEAIHGDRSQGQRERALGRFTSGEADVLVATDVAARGIHVDGVACVVQLDPPSTDKDYVHRAGRTGRAGAAGTVVTLVTPEKAADVRKMQRTLGLDVGFEPVPTGSIGTAPSATTPASGAPAVASPGRADRAGRPDTDRRRSGEGRSADRSRGQQPGPDGRGRTRSGTARSETRGGSRAGTARSETRGGSRAGAAGSESRGRAGAGRSEAGGRNRSSTTGSEARGRTWTGTARSDARGRDAAGTPADRAPRRSARGRTTGTGASDRQDARSGRPTGAGGGTSRRDQAGSRGQQPGRRSSATTRTRRRPA